MYALPSESVEPHVGMVASTPRPKTLREASVMVHVATANAATMMAGASVLGRK